MTRWPTKKQMDAALKEMEDELPSRALAPGASPVERTKHAICAEFIIYMKTRNMSQQELAAKLNIDKAIVSKIVHYHFDEFTIDRLIKYLSILEPNLIIEVKARVA